VTSDKWVLRRDLSSRAAISSSNQRRCSGGGRRAKRGGDREGSLMLDGSAP
jgi:hypothetical protein